jgi:hypothetical protein
VTVFAGDEKLTTALLDRLAHHATVLTTKGKKLSHAQTMGGDVVRIRLWKWRSNGITERLS